MFNYDTWIYIQEYHGWFPGVIVFLCGACVGSFLNVCIYRIPKGESVVRPASHNAQGHPLAWYDNIPLVSWFILRGRDRQTGARFSVRYVLVEWLTAVLFLLCWWWLPGQSVVAGWILISLLIPAALIDLDHMILPDIFTVGGAVLGFALSLLFPVLHLESGRMGFLPDMFSAGLHSVLGILIGSGMVLWMLVLGEWLLKKQVMGEGDIFFAGCIGAFCGWEGALFSVFGGSVIGLCVLLPLICVERMFKVSLMRVEAPVRVEDVNPEGATNAAVDTHASVPIGMGVAVPFGPWMALGTLVYFLGGSAFIDPYFQQVQALLNLQ